MFFNKKSWIRFYSLEPAVVDLFPVVPASTLHRTWREPEVKKKKCPFSGLISSSNCPAITTFSSLGYVVVAPADFIITTNGDGINFNWQTNCIFTKGMNGYIANHDEEQTVPILDDPNNTLRTIVKIETPWRVKASDDVVLLQTPVHYMNESRFSVATGILDPKFAHVVHVQMFWKVLEGETVIKAGTPLAQYIPMSRKYLSPKNFDLIVDKAGKLEYDLEESFQYANTANILKFDSIQNRINRVTRVLNAYRNENNKL
jgi:hypothetical protein